VIPAQLGDMIEITTVGNRVSKWGEGPIWWEGVLYYVDIEDHAVVKYDPSTGEETIWDVGERVGTVVPRASGGLVIAGDSGFHFLDTETGQVEAISDPEPTKPNNRFNDGKCSPDGRFFAGTISLVKNTGDAALYRLDPDGRTHLVLPRLTNSNGIVWSANGETVYHIDTPTKVIARYSYNEESGEFEGGEVAVDVSSMESSPDGMAIDADGSLWVAYCHGACVKQYDPDNGAELNSIELPCLETTACAFGGPDMADLYVTTGIHKSEVEADAGRLFVIRGIGARGAKNYAFKG